MMHIVGTYVLSIEAGSIQRTYKEYNNVPCILYACGMFVLLRNIADKVGQYKWCRTIFETLGKYTFPVYLMQCIWRDVLHVDRFSIVYRLLAPYPIYLLVIAVTRIFRNIPGL